MSDMYMYIYMPMYMHIYMYMYIDVFRDVGIKILTEEEWAKLLSNKSKAQADESEPPKKETAPVPKLRKRVSSFQ